jgi:Uma2 family endonuclease
MSVIEAPAVAAPAPVGGHVLYRTDWAGYRKLHELVGERPVRINYDRGTLEIMTISHLHEHYKGLIARLVEAVTEELGIDLVGGGSTTFQRKDLDRGLEPDECFWIAGARRMLGVREFDWKVHPPPDLVVEVEVTRSEVDRPAMYAAMGVPELWRCSASGALTMHRLTAEGYRAAAESAALPQLTPAAIGEHLALIGTNSDTEIVRRFRAWVRSSTARKA